MIKSSLLHDDDDDDDDAAPLNDKWNVVVAVVLS